MKIGEFAKKYDIPVATIRHYLNMGLIVPEHDGYQREFTEVNCRELENIIELKGLGFQLDEILIVLNVHRCFNVNDEQLYDREIEILEGKKYQLYDQRNALTASIRKINKAIRQAEDNRRKLLEEQHSKEEKGHEGAGIPLKALGKLKCPLCGNSMNLLDANIFEGLIGSGELRCDCGYRASIRDGYLFAGKLENLDQDDDFGRVYYGIGDEEPDVFMIFEGVSQSNEWPISVYKNYQWIHNALKDFDAAGKTIFIPDISAFYLYSFGDAEMFSNADVFVGALTARSIQEVKEHVARVHPGLKVTYLVNQDGQLPLAEGSIDLVIDMMGTYNMDFFLSESYYNVLKPYLAPDAIIAAVYDYYKPGAESRNRIHELYRKAGDNIALERPLLRLFSDMGFNTRDSISFKMTDPGRYCKYHVKGDTHIQTAIIAERCSDD